MKKAVLVLALSLPFILLWPQTAYGCICTLSPKGLSPEEAQAALIKDFKNATAIFFGEVIEVDFLKAKLKVEKIWKGEAKDEITMTVGSKNDQGEYVISSCDFPFRKGERYLVFAYSRADGLKAHVCGRTTSMKYAELQMNKLDEIKLPEIRNQKADPPL